MEKIVTKAEIDKILSGAMGEYEVIAPVMKDDIVFLKPVKNSDEVLYGYTNSLNTLKDFFLPSREVLFEYAGGVPEVKSDVKPRVVFGVRPCDAASLMILDKVFGGDYEDVYYFARRRKTILAGLSCEDPPETCFCTSVNEGMDPRAYFDILLTRLGSDVYFAEIVTEKGKTLLGQYGTAPGAMHKQEKQNKLEEFKKKITRKLKVPENFERSFKSEYWEKASRKCIACGICRYLCPTCSCFSIADEDNERVRYWQPCSFTCFTKEAAGTNPRAGKSERYKQWYFHKFDYSRKNTGMIACVGCGRCIRNCPVKTDFMEVLSNLYA
jgi:ferredoxin